MSQARLRIAVGMVVVALAGAAGGLILLRRPSRAPADLPPPVATPSPPGLPATPPLPLERPAPPPPVAAASTTPSVLPPPTVLPPAPELQALVAELTAALPGLGVRPPARLTAASLHGDLLTLTFNAEFRPYLADLSALDELTAALSASAQAHGYRHLELRLIDPDGRSRSVAELTTIPPARRPRPEPIDDGVRR